MADITEFLPDPLPADPLALTQRWLEEAWARRAQPNPNAMVLATSTPEGKPSARVVLCKDIVPQPGYLVFFTNYLSMKGKQLKDNARAAAVMHWDAMHRQVRIDGPISFAPAAESDGYFASRTWPKRIAAWNSASSSAKIAASRASVGVRGATGTWPGTTPQSGSGSARWSIFPLPVSGSAGSTTKAAGTM